MTHDVTRDVTCDVTRYVTRDMTRDVTRHMTCDMFRRRSILSKFQLPSSYYEYVEEKDYLMNELQGCL